jgi:tetratricopeptide (TPR) repeat protein
MLLRDHAKSNFYDIKGHRMATMEGEDVRSTMSERTRTIVEKGSILARVVAAALLCVAAPGMLRAQGQQQQQDQGQGQQGQPPAESSSKKKDQDKTAPAADADPHKYDAYNAEQDIEVGTFYMHKGDLDAAIPRFEEAASLRPTYGKPRLLLAEAYEKKKDNDSALKYYKEYLKVYPNAPDAKKIQKKIEKLEGK